MLHYEGWCSHMVEGGYTFRIVSPKNKYRCCACSDEIAFFQRPSSALKDRIANASFRANPNASAAPESAAESVGAHGWLTWYERICVLHVTVRGIAVQ